MSIRQLHEFCRITQGGRLGLSGNDFVSEGIPAYGAGGMNGYLPRHEFDEPAVILSSIGARCGKCFYAEGKWASLANTQLIFPDPDQANARFLWFQLNDENRWHRSGTGQPFIKPADVKAHRVFLPPLYEQRRIAEVLDRAEALRAKRRAGLAQLDTLTQAIFLDLFGDPVSNSHGWLRSELLELCLSTDDIKCGPFGTQLGKNEYKSTGVPLWGIKQVNARFEVPTREFLDTATADRLVQYSIKPGDIVMTRKGTVGNCAVYPEQLPFGIMHSDLLRLRVDPERCEAIFLAHQLHHSRDVERQVALISGGAVMPGINVTKLKRLNVFVPPISLQRDFARHVAAVEQLKAAQRASLAEMDALFASLQHRAFRGEL